MKRRLPASALAGAALASFLCLIGATDSAAQSSNSRPTEAAIAGTVHDPSGAVIPGPTVVVRHERSGLEQVAEGATDGSFLVRRLAAGAFIVTVSAPGFASTVERVEAPGAAPLTITLSPAPIVEQRSEEHTSE